MDNGEGFILIFIVLLLYYLHRYNRFRKKVIQNEKEGKGRFDLLF